MCRKIPEELENPIDNIFINAASATSVFYKEYDLSPNTLTTFSLIFGILCPLLYAYNFIYFSAITFIFSYYYDNLDGFYARKYNRVTRFGDLYDHFADVFKGMALTYVMRNSPKLYIIVAVLVFGSLIVSFHLSLQELICPKCYRSEFLTFVKVPFSRDTAKKYIKFTRFFGSGTFVTVIILTIVL